MYSNIRTVYPSKNHVTTHPAQSDLGQYCLPLYWQQNYLTVDLGRWYAQPVSNLGPLSAHQRNAVRMAFCSRPDFTTCLLGIRRLITSSSGTKPAQEILDEQPRLMRACVSEHSLLAYSKQVWRCNFYPKCRPIVIRQLYMYALNITKISCAYTFILKKEKNVMRFKVQCLIFLFILSSKTFGEIFGVFRWYIAM